MHLHVIHQERYKMKLIDKMNESIKTSKTFFSFEFFPPRTDEVRPQTRWLRFQNTFERRLLGRRGNSSAFLLRL